MILIFPHWASGIVLKGRIYDVSTGLPVPDVGVVMPESGKATVTGPKGIFEMDVPEPGRYLLKFSHIGYVDYEQFVSTGKSFEAGLEPKKIGLKEVQVSAGKRISPLKEITVEPLAWESSITYIPASEIKKMGSVTALDALKYSTNGLPSTQGRRKKYYYLVRGQNMASDYSINGVSLSTNGAGPMAQWIEAPAMLPANMIESIEVVRSGNSLLLGFSGLNGVVNIKTKTFDRFETQAEAGYGTFNSYRIGVLHGGKAGDFNYALSIFNDKTDGPEGRHSYENLWNIYGKAGYHYKDIVKVTLENFYTYGTRFVTQAVDYQGLTLPKRQLADIWEYDPMRYHISTLRVKVNESKSASTELQMSYILNRMDLYPDTYEFSVDPATNEAIVGDSVIRNHMLNEPDTILTIGVFQALRPFEGNVMRIAGMYASSANYTHGKSKKSIYSLALLDQHHFGELDLHAGVKLIREFYDFYVPNQGFGAENRAVQNEWQPVLLNLSAGMSYRLNYYFIFNGMLNTGSLPGDNTALQLFDDGTTGSLKREQRTGIDLGLEYKLPEAGNLIFTLFSIHQKNTSEYTTRAYYDTDGLIRYYERNINLSTFGAEIACQSVSLWKYWSFFGNLSYKFAWQSTSSIYKKYTKQPLFIGNAGLSFSRRGLDLNMMGKYVSEYNTDRFLQKDVEVGNYFNLDMTATYGIPRMKLELFGHVVNIFDVRYCTVSPVYPDFGRQFKAGLRVRL